jgi:hypothetical protein
MPACMRHRCSTCAAAHTSSAQLALRPRLGQCSTHQGRPSACPWPPGWPGPPTGPTAGPGSRGLRGIWAVLHQLTDEALRLGAVQHSAWWWGGRCSRPESKLCASATCAMVRVPEPLQQAGGSGLLLCHLQLQQQLDLHLRICQPVGRRPPGTSTGTSTPHHATSCHARPAHNTTPCSQHLRPAALCMSPRTWAHHELRPGGDACCARACAGHHPAAVLAHLHS